MGTWARANFVPATAHRIEEASFSHDTLNIDKGGQCISWQAEKKREAVVNCVCCFC